MYLTSPGRPNDIGLQMGNAILAAGKGRGDLFLSSVF